MFKDYLTSFTVFWRYQRTIRKKSSEKKLFLFIFFRPPDPRSEKKIPVNQLIKKIWPK